MVVGDGLRRRSTEPRAAAEVRRPRGPRRQRVRRGRLRSESSEVSEVFFIDYIMQEYLTENDDLYT